VAEFLRELIGAESSKEPSPRLRSARGDPRLMGEQMQRAWSDWLAALTARGSVVLVLGDLHWADLPSVRAVDEAHFGSSLRMPAATQLVPHAASYVVDCARRPLHHVEWIEAQDCGWAAIHHNAPNPGCGVGAHEPNLCSALGAKQIKELAQRSLLLPRARPEQTFRIVIHDDAEVAVPLAVRDFVDADPRHASERIAKATHAVGDHLGRPLPDPCLREGRSSAC
jgi:hypothetical protein